MHACQSCGWNCQGLTLQVLAGVQHVGCHCHVEGTLHLSRQLLVDVPILNTAQPIKMNDR